MRFSIVVPVYNSASYLEACLMSVKKQSKDEWELLLVDDGSTDESGKTIDIYAAKDERIHAYHQENQGQFFARKKGIENASGEYIIFLDSDDMLEANCIERLEMAAETKPDIILYTGRVFNKGKDTGKRIGVVSEKEKLTLRMIRNKLAFSNEANSLWTKAIRRNLFSGDETDYSCYKGMCCGEDKAMLLYPFTKANNIYYIQDSLYRYNYYGESVIHKCNVDSVKRMLMNETFSLIKLYMKMWGMESRKDEEKLCTYYLRNYILVYYNTRKYCKERNEYKKFCKYKLKKAIDKSYFRLCGIKLLTVSEKFKLLVTATGL